LLLLASAAMGFAQKLPQPTRMWSVGPLTKSDPVMGIAFGTGGATITGPRVDTQTGSIFAATRSLVFAGDRIALASKVGMRKVEGAQNPDGFAARSYGCEFEVGGERQPLVDKGLSQSAKLCDAH